MPSEDIKNLFGRFGNRSGQYREIVREEQTTESIVRWPLLSTVEASRMRDIPGVHQAAALPPVALPAAVGALSQRSDEHSVSSAAKNSSMVTTKLAEPAAPVAAIPASKPSALTGLPPSAAHAIYPSRASGAFVAEPPPIAAPAMSPLGRFGAAPVVEAASVLAVETPSPRPLPMFEALGHPSGAQKSGSLSSLFGRLAGPQEPEPASNPARAMPAFRRLRRT
jgi:hypothetical protein